MTKEKIKNIWLKHIRFSTLLCRSIKVFVTSKIAHEATSAKSSDSMK